MKQDEPGGKTLTMPLAPQEAIWRWLARALRQVGESKLACYPATATDDNNILSTGRLTVDK